MGFFDWVKNTFGAIFGRKKKEELPELPKEEPKVKLEDFKKKPETEVRETREIRKAVTGEERDYIKRPQLPRLSDDIISRTKNWKSRYTEITDETRGNWEREINPRNIPITTGYYRTTNSLRENTYDIYRNIILANIKDDKLVADIFKSKMIQNRIVGILKLRILVKHGNKPQRVEEAEYEVLGLTPEMAVNRGICENLVGTYNQGFAELRDKISELTDGRYPKGNVITGTEIEVIDAQIGFNYA